MVSQDSNNSIECNSGRRWSSLSSWVRQPFQFSAHASRTDVVVMTYSRHRCSHPLRLSRYNEDSKRKLRLESLSTARSQLDFRMGRRLLGSISYRRRCQPSAYFRALSRDSLAIFPLAQRHELSFFVPQRRDILLILRCYRDRFGICLSNDRFSLRFFPNSERCRSHFFSSTSRRSYSHSND